MNYHRETLSAHQVRFEVELPSHIELLAIDRRVHWIARFCTSRPRSLSNHLQFRRLPRFLPGQDRQIIAAEATSLHVDVLTFRLDQPTTMLISRIVVPTTVLPQHIHVLSGSMILLFVAAQPHRHPPSITAMDCYQAIISLIARPSTIYRTSNESFLAADAFLQVSHSSKRNV